MLEMCVAVIHHIHTEKRRQFAINELIRITKPNGKILPVNLFWVWKILISIINHPRKLWLIKNGSNPQDTLISWNNKGEILQRFYHLFIKGELEQLFINCGIKREKIHSYNQRGNWIITVN